MDVRHDRDGVTEPSNIDVAGIDAAMITQKQQYGGARWMRPRIMTLQPRAALANVGRWTCSAGAGTPVGQIILRPGEDLATMVWGCLLLLASFCFFVLSIYAMLVSEHMPDTGASASNLWRVYWFSPGV